ncbi:MAG TPA: DUF5655 domain-containing protein [Thermoanaerobaculia bacterium]|jgi:hypothetical protein|nr:DUF5655 domain-containing protein [Thermoanaerobaculia bacterium]
MAKPLWSCPHCERTFANRNQTHSCGTVGALDAHFARRPPAVRELFDAFVARVRAIGPVTILPEKTRIAFHVRMSFAMVMPRHDALVGHLVLARRVDDPRLHKIETFSPRNHVHHFRVRSVAEIDAIAEWIAEAYAVSEQKHLGATAR